MHACIRMCVCANDFRKVLPQLPQRHSHLLLQALHFNFGYELVKSVVAWLHNNNSGISP